MQMLGSRQGMGGGGGDRGEPPSERESSPGKPAAGKTAAKAGGKFDDFEDDIPF
jgi:single-strand DNA-binding protein